MQRIMSEIDVKVGLKTILSRIDSACQNRPSEFQCIKPNLVAVSKTKPIEMIIDCYEEGQRHFGENYFQELDEKSHHPEILDKCKEILWHYIGHLQSNKINKVLAVPGIYCIETVDRQSLANKLNTNWPKFNKTDQKLRVFIQVNTSNEDEKSGVEPKDVINLAKFILDECPNLKFDGLMTIGRFGYDLSQGPNPDFISLKTCRDNLCKSLNLDWKNVALSMGMSDDFEHAIEMGSTNVRVGSSIFGYRTKKT